MSQEKFTSTGALQLPKGEEFEVVGKEDMPEVSGPWGDFSMTIVKSLKTGKLYSVPTGNAQMLYGICKKGGG